MMKILLTSCLIFLLFSPTLTLRILHFVPGFGGSHVLFGYRLANALQSHGHNVTMLIAFAPPFAEEAMKFNAPEGVNEHKFLAEWKDFDESFLSIFQKQAFRVIDFKLTLRFALAVTKELSSVCNQLLNDFDLLANLQQDDYDIGLTHYFDPCSVGIFRQLGIKHQFMFSAGAFIVEQGAEALDIPVNPSFIPSSLGNHNDQMTFIQRLKNSLGIGLAKFVGPLIPNNLIAQEIQQYNEVAFRPENLNDIWGETPGILINGESFLDFPRPLTFGSLFLGDLSQYQPKSLKNSSKTQKLDASWTKILDDPTRKGTILFSMGTIANTSDMPEFMKVAFFDAFTELPDYNIIWKYEGDPIHAVDQNPHIKIAQWVPQAAILKHASTSLFISHGGYNSLVETTRAGIPTLLIPLFGDQMTNAKRAERHGLGVSLEKMTLTKENVLEAMRKLLENESYRRRAKKFGDMLSDTIGSSIDQIDYHFKHQVENTWYSRYHIARKRLNFSQKKCLDVLLLFTVPLVLLIRFTKKSIFVILFLVAIIEIYVQFVFMHFC